MKKYMIAHYFILQCCLLPALACGMILFFSACSFGAQYSLIDSHEPLPPEIEAKINAGEGPFKPAKRAVKVRLTSMVWGEERLAVNDVLILNLFDDAQYKAGIDRVSENVADTVTIRGRLDSFPSGYIMISSTGGHSMANIQIPEKNLEYIVIYDSGTQAHYLLEIDPLKKDVKKEGPVLIPPEIDRDSAFPRKTD
jgi:hypothetical protein